MHLVCITSQKHAITHCKYYIRNILNLPKFRSSQHHFGLFLDSENNMKNWKDDLTDEENIEKLRPGWGFVPGVPLKPDVDYSDDFQNVPEENKQRVLEAEKFVYDWLATKSSVKVDPKDEHDAYKKAKIEEKAIPEDWKDAFDMRTWRDFPDREIRKY